MRPHWSTAVICAFLLLAVDAGRVARAQHSSPGAAAHPTDTPPPPPPDTNRRRFRTTLGTWRVKAVDLNTQSFILHSETGEDSTFTVNDKTAVLRDGKKVSLANLKVGDVVSASYDDRYSNQKVAVEIKVRPAIDLAAAPDLARSVKAQAAAPPPARPPAGTAAAAAAPPSRPPRTEAAAAAAPPSRPVRTEAAAAPPR
jgi:hypothetical protein